METIIYFYAYFSFLNHHTQPINSIFPCKNGHTCVRGFRGQSWHTSNQYMGAICAGCFRFHVTTTEK